MKVLHIVQRYPPAIGGSETWCRNICCFLAGKGIITKVATINLCHIEEFHKDLEELGLDKRYIDLGKYDYDKGVFVIRYNLWKIGSKRLSSCLVRLLLYVMKLCKMQLGDIFRISPHSFEMYFRLFKEIKDADIVHLHTLPYFHNLVGFLIARLLRKKIVITPHFHPGHPHYEMNMFYRMMNKCDAVIAVSKYEKDYFCQKGVEPRKICITGNCIMREDRAAKGELDTLKLSLFKNYGIREGTKKIIFIGRKEFYKGIGTLIDAMQEIAYEESDMDFCLFLVGPASTDFNNKYSPLGNLGRLKVIDFGCLSEREKTNLLAISDLLVLPSEFEAFGIVFLEAWEHKKPVVGMNRGAMPEVINGAGLCAEYGDICNLKEKIKTVLFNDELARNLGEAGKEKLDKNYSLEIIGKKVFNIYHTLRRKKRILIVSHLFPPWMKGGAEVVAYEQSKMLKKMGFDIKVLTGEVKAKIKQYAVRREKGDFDIIRINLHDIDFEHYQYMNFSKNELEVRFRRAIYEIAPDLVHFHNIYPLSLKIIEEVHRMHIPSVITLHDYWGICFKNTLITDQGELCDKKGTKCLHCRKGLYDFNGKLYSLLERNELFIEYLNKINLLISPSEYLIKRFINCGVRLEKTTVINNGINISRFKNIKKTRFSKIRFGYIGIIRPHKGIENLFVSISHLNSEEKKRISPLMLVGSGDELFLEYCKKLIYELGISKFVKFVGEKRNDEIQNILCNIDVLIVPSIWPENSPVTIMEAMATGTPVLASNLGGIPELVQDGINGYLHQYNEPKALTQNLRRFIEHPEIREEMRPGCLEKARQYDLIRQVKLIAGHYNRLIGCGQN